MVVLFDLDEEGNPFDTAVTRRIAPLALEPEKNDNGFAAALACYPYALGCIEAFDGRTKANLSSTTVSSRN